MTDIRNQGVTTKTELDEEVAEVLDAAGATGEAAAPLDYVEEEVQAEADLTALQEDMALLREELALLRARVSVIKAQAKTVVTERARWADASAHEQLGDYPWLKLAGAMTLTFLTARALRFLPLSAMATAGASLLVSRNQRR